MFEPSVTLVPEPDGEFSIFATTMVPNACFSAGRATRRAPTGIKLGAGVVPVRLALKYKQLKEPGGPRAVQHRAFNLKVSDGFVVRTFVVLEDRILGSSDAIVSSDSATGAVSMVNFGPPVVALTRPPLTPLLCQGVVVATTPQPGNFTSPSQQLRLLGVVDATRATVHRAAIHERMKQIGYSVRTTDIASGPAVTVAASRDSVFANAQ